MLDARGVTFAYGNAQVLHGVDVHADAAHVISLIGPNGSGKSTLLRCLTGLLPCQGDIRVDGQPVRSLSPRQRAQQIAFLPQSHENLRGITLRELIAMGRAPYHSSAWFTTSTDRAKIEWASRYMQLDDLMDRRIEQLSGGERQRAWIAMIVAQDTPIIVLDEPATYMDMRHQQEMLATIRDLRDSHSKTVIAVFHDINHAIDVSDQIYVLSSGSVCAAGTSAEVINSSLIARVYGVKAVVGRCSGSRRDVVVPLSITQEEKL